MHVQRESLPQVRAMGLSYFVWFACVEYRALSMEYVALLMECMAVAGEGDGSGFVCNREARAGRISQKSACHSI